MAIVNNLPCPKCQETGHDKTGNHLVVFDDGNMMCKKSHYHRSGQVYFVSKGEAPEIVDQLVTGEIKYTPTQFKEMDEAGKLADPSIRELALSGMKKGDAYEVCTEEERAAMEEEWRLDMEWFDGLKFKHLVDRGIHGTYAKLYNVRVGHDGDGKVNKHYYPQYEEGVLVSAKQRTLPKSFVGGLGKLFGVKDLWGMHTMKAVEESGQTYHSLTLVGGEPDAMATQQMLVKKLSVKTDKADYTNRLYHVWSVPRGEACVDDIVAARSEIEKFREIKLCFDNDEEGKKLTKKVQRLLLGLNVKVVTLPKGIKDPNQALKERYITSFVESWWNAKEPQFSGVLSPLSKFIKKALKTPAMGLSYPWEGMNKVTFGIRDHYLSVWGAGTGVGKTKTTKAIVKQLTEVHRQRVCVIYLEEPPEKTLRSFAGERIGKDLTVPPINDPEDEMYEVQFDYTEEEATQAIQDLVDENMIWIGDLEGRKDVESVMEVMEEALARGFTKFIVDNLTAFKHKNEKGGDSGSAQAIDETMRALGTMKDEHPVWIMLLSHLSRPDRTRVPHELGGEVLINDFRGAGSITFWANDVWGIRRNTKANSLHEKCITVWENIKNRDVGFMTGTKVGAKMNLSTAQLEEGDYNIEDPSQELPPQQSRKPKNNLPAQDEEF